MKIIYKILNVIVTAFLLTNLIGLFLININFSGLGIVKSATDELAPEIKVNNLIIYQKQNSYEKDDTIVYSIKNNYSIAKVRETTEYLTYIKDNTGKEYGPISNADINGKAIIVLNTKYMVLYFVLVFSSLGYLVFNIIKGVQELKKNSNIIS